MKNIKIEPKTLIDAKLIFIDIISDGNYPDYKKQIIGIDHRWIKPILISQTEKIEIGDYIYNSYTNQITIARKNVIDELQYDYYNEENEWYKILALPEHFSSEQLQMIEDGKLKNGDNVLIECELKYRQLSSGCGFIDKIVKLNSSNHITIDKIEEKMYTKEQIIFAYNQGVIDGSDPDCKYTEGTEWFEQNFK